MKKTRQLSIPGQPAQSVGNPVHRSGFTIVELLTIITIIVILAALLLPAFSRAKATTQGAVCMSNLRQLLLKHKDLDDDTSGKLGMSSALLSSLGNRNSIAICPMAPPRPVRMTNWYWTGSVSDAWQFWDENGVTIHSGSYSRNGWFGGVSTDAGTPHPDTFQTEGDIYYPSNTPFFGDGTDEIAAARADVPPRRNLFGIPPTLDGSLRCYIIPRHGSRPRKAPTDHPPEEKLPGAVNMAFYDGHVEQVQLERLWFLYWHKDYLAPEKRPGLK